MISAPYQSVQEFTAVVVSIEIGGSLIVSGSVNGMPEAISYNVAVHLDSGSQSFERVVPHNDRGEVEIRAAKVGTIFRAYRFGDRMFYDIPERENFGDCE